MKHNTVTTKRRGRRKVVAVVGALGVAAAGYGVYATTLTVTGASGTVMQAGATSSLTPTSGCDTDGVNVVQGFTNSHSNGVGYGVSSSGHQITGIALGCAGKVLKLSVQRGGVFTETGTPVTLVANNTGASPVTPVVIPDSNVSFATAYSVYLGT